MTIMTHKIWPNISGGSTRYFQNGYGNYSYSKSSFSGLGTRDFTFSRYTESNSCCRGGYNSYNGFGYGGYSGLNRYSSYGMGGYGLRGMGSFGFGGCSGLGFGGPKWFTKFMETTTAIMAGLNIGGAFASLFVKDTYQADTDLAANNGSGDVSGNADGKVYRNKTVVTVTEEKGADGEKSYKVTKTTTKVESTDGKTDEIVLIENPYEGTVFLNDNHEVVFDTQVVYAKGDNGQITKTTKQVLSADNKVDTLEAVYGEGLDAATVKDLKFGSAQA